MMDKYKYGTLIARSMGDKLSAKDLEELDAWLEAREENMRLFEDLTNDSKSEWARQWFSEAGVNTQFIKWKKTGGWYKPEWKVKRDFYLVWGVMFLVLAGVYLLIRYVH